jgi:hypothetical protein
MLNLVEYSRVSILVLALALPSGMSTKAADATREAIDADSIWVGNNRVAWEAAPYDTKKRNPEQRAQMFQRLGIRHYAYLSSTDPWDSMDDVNTSQRDVNAEIEAMQRHGIDILAWYFWVNTDDPATVPTVKATLEAFKYHKIHPQIWVTNSFAYMPRKPEDWAKYLPQGLSMPANNKDYEALSTIDKETIQNAVKGVEESNFPKTPQQEHLRVEKEALRIKAFVDLASPYGCRVNIYNHRGWFGMIDNELAIIHRLEQMGVKDVGMVYNFSHSRDHRHDDSNSFPDLWAKIKDHVVAVNAAGLSGIEDVVYPSQGDRETAMMKTIQDSGWRGPIGLLVLWKPDDTEVVLRNAGAGLDWEAAELRSPGSGGPKPMLPRP